MLKCKNVLLAFLTVFSLFSVPISGEETPLPPEISQPAAAEEEKEEQVPEEPEESPRPEDPVSTEEPSSSESSEEPAPTPESDSAEAETPEPTPDVPEEETPEEPEITESETVEGTGGDDVIDLEGFLYWYEGPNPHITAVLAQ